MKKKYTILFFLILCMFLIVSSKSYAFENENTYENMIDNILLIGEDSSKRTGISRADTMIILTIDNMNKCLKLTSLARDTLVDIPNRGYDKLNHAYAYGGIDLLLDTINQNLNMNIKDYAIVDFNSFIEIVDIIGGVDIEVKENEISQLNLIIDACYRLSNNNKEEIKYITTSGNHHLNGYQALAYARIRKMDTIYKRDERQRQILINTAQTLSNTPISKYPSIIKSIVRYVDVNIAFEQLVKMAFVSHELATYEIKQMQFPKYEYREETKLHGSFVVDWNKEKNLEYLHKFIYTY